MLRLFVAPAALAAGELRVRGDEHHYLMRVRRARLGDLVELVDGEGRRADASIAAIGDLETTLTVGAPASIESKPPLMRALVPLIKGDRMDACLEKLVEVGADAIIVWPAARSVVVLDASKRDSRLAKYRALVQSAARQSGRAQIPLVDLAETLASAIAALPIGSRFVLDPVSDSPLPPALDADVTLASGPEGGLSPAELALLSSSGFASLGLGPRILRAETAPLVATALIRAATRS